MNNILSIVGSNECVGCSVCIPACPIDIIHKNHSHGFLRPSLNDDDCLRKCTICMDVCPAIPTEVPTENKNVADLDHFVAYSKNNIIRLSGQSGGFITQLLIELFDDDKIDCVVVTYLDIQDFHNKNRIVDKSMNYKDELLKCSGSKYTSSVMSDDFFKKLRRYKAIAFVGLPCQLEATSQVSYLRKKIFCKIGLVCDRVLSENFSKLFLDQDVIDFQYRSKEKNGYPGDIKISYKNRSDRFIDKRIRHRLKFLYTQPQCFGCSDKNAKYADLVVGDNYIDQYKFDKKGTSIVEDRIGLLQSLKFSHLNIERISKEKYNGSIQLEKKIFLASQYKSYKFFRLLVSYLLPVFHIKIIPLSTKILVSVTLKRLVIKLYKVKL